MMLCGYFNTDRYHFIRHSDEERISTHLLPLLESHQETIQKYPNCSVILSNDDKHFLLTEDRSLVIELKGDGQVEKSPAKNSPGYGIKDSSVIVHKNKLFQFGGMNVSSHEPINELYELDIDTLEWKRIEFSLFEADARENEPKKDGDENEEEEEGEEPEEQIVAELSVSSAPSERINKKSEFDVLSRYGHTMLLDTNKERLVVYGGKKVPNSDAEEEVKIETNEIFSYHVQEEKWKLEKENLPTPLTHHSAISCSNKTCLFRDGQVSEGGPDENEGKGKSSTFWIKCDSEKFRFVSSFRPPFCYNLLEKTTFDDKTEEENEGESDSEEEDTPNQPKKQVFHIMEYFGFLNFSTLDQILMKNRFVDIIVEEEFDRYLVNATEEVLNETTFLNRSRFILRDYPALRVPDVEPPKTPLKKKESFFRKLFAQKKKNNKKSDPVIHPVAEEEVVKTYDDVGDILMLYLPPILFQFCRSYKSELLDDLVNAFKGLYNYTVLTTNSNVQDRLISMKFVEEARAGKSFIPNFIKSVLEVDNPMVTYMHFLEIKEYTKLPGRFRVVMRHFTDLLFRVLRFDDCTKEDIAKLKLIKQVLVIMKPFVSISSPGNAVDLSIKLANVVMFSSLGKKMFVLALNIGKTKKKMKRIRKFLEKQNGEKLRKVLKSFESGMEKIKLSEIPKLMKHFFENEMMFVKNEEVVQEVEEEMKEFGIKTLLEEEDEKEKSEEDEEDEYSTFLSIGRKVEELERRKKGLFVYEEKEEKEFLLLRVKIRMLKKLYEQVPLSFVKYFLSTISSEKKKYSVKDFTPFQLLKLWQLFECHIRVLEKQDFVTNGLEGPHLKTMLRSLLMTIQPMMDGLYHKDGDFVKSVFHVLISVINDLVPMLSLQSKMERKEKKMKDPMKRERARVEKEKLMEEKYKVVKENFRKECYVTCSNLLRRDQRDERIILAGIEWVNGLRGNEENQKLVNMAEIYYGFATEEERVEEFKRRVRSLWFE